MKIISGGPQAGKTVELIKACEKEGGYMVCANRIYGVCQSPRSGQGV